MTDLEESESPPLITRRRRRRYRINLSRHVYNEREFTESFINQEEYTASSEFEPSSLAKTLRRNFLPSRCTCKDILQSWFPIVEWLPAYNIRRDLAHDIAGGLTVAIMHIPQGKRSDVQTGLNILLKKNHVVLILNKRFVNFGELSAQIPTSL